MVQVRRATVGWIREAGIPGGVDPESEPGSGGGAARGPVPEAPPPGAEPTGFPQEVRADLAEPDPAPVPDLGRGRAPDSGRDLSPALGYATPLLVLLAAMSTLEGYIWLNLVSADRWRSWAVGFAVLTFAAAIALVRPRQRTDRLATTLVVTVALLMLGATVVAVFARGTAVACLAGAADLLFALIALGTVAATEHSARRPD